MFLQVTISHVLSFISICRLLRVTIDVTFSLFLLHGVTVGYVADVLEVHAVCISILCREAASKSKASVTSPTITRCKNPRT
jgi:hypothetical protein